MSWSRRSFLKVAGLGSIGLPLLTGSGERARKPNIILIMADDFGYECVGANGGLSYRTPNLDRMAQEGVRFTHCYATPLCTPSRVQIMTGKYNFRNYTEFGSLRPGETTFAHLLRDAGYRTCVVGKWQLAGRVRGARYRGEGTLPEDAGFDEHCLWQVRVRGSRYWDPTIQRNGRVFGPLEGRYGPDIFAEYALGFIRQNADRFFFLYYPMVLTHAPFRPTPDSPDWQSSKNANDPRYFADMVAYADGIVGRILGLLRELRLDRNTLVLFTGDNGTDRRIVSRLGDRLVRGRKGETVDAGTHVPLIAWWPGRAPRGRTCEDLVDFTDFLPTLLDAAGVRPPAGFVLDGRSFLPQVLGHSGQPRKWIFGYYEPKWGRWKRSVYIQDKRWKVYEDGRIYDLARDIDEKRPLGWDTLTPPQKAEVGALREALRKFVSGIETMGS